MNYTREDIIIFPDDPRLKDANGKECYGYNVVTDAVSRAEQGYPCKLYCIQQSSKHPFTVIDARGEYYDFTFLILKKDLEKKTVPFDLSLKEDRDALMGRRIYSEWDLLDIVVTSFTGLTDGEWRFAGRNGEVLFKNFVFADEPNKGMPVGKEVLE